jgi:serine/threonine-protein kinase
MPEVTEQLKTALADRYVIERELGAGGMATVYLAHDVKHERKVALKVLRPELAAVIGGDRFLQEIKVTANLQHSHILPLYDSGEADTFLYYVMPYVEGETLRAKIDKEKQLAVDEAVGLAGAVAAALEHAHKQGVVHRDIKPENILLRDGEPLIADFGIALAVSHAGGNRLTETGLSIGTPHYMSPEQAMGDRELDARSDVYSLAAVLYEVLTGEPPYTGSTAQAIVARVITEEPRQIHLQRRTVPPHVADAVHKALNKLPADRFGSAASFAEALVTPGYVTPSHTQAGAAPEAPAQKLSRRVLIAAGAVGVLAIAAAFAAGRGTVPAPESRVVRFSVVDSLLGGRCCGASLAVSPDGRSIVTQRRSEDGEAMLALRSLDGHEMRPLPGTEGASSPFFSPDGRWLGFETDGRLRKISLAGGPPITIAEIGDEARGASWGSNDSIVFAHDDDDRLYLVAASGGTPRRVTDGGTTDFHRNPSYLPGNRRVLFGLDDPGPLEDMRIGVLDLETGTVDTLQTPGTMARFAPPNRLVFTGADGSLLVQPFDPGRGTPTGPAVALLDGVRVYGDGTGEFAVSASGDLIYVPGDRGGSESLVLADGRSRDDVSLPRQANLEDPAISPDGRRVVLRITNEGDDVDVWLLDRDQGTLTRFTTEGRTFMPAWTPDGSRIAYAVATGANDSVPAAIYWRAADGSGDAELLMATDDAIAPLGFLPDGSQLLVQGWGREGLRSDIGIFTLGDSTVRWIVSTEFRETHGRVSPDGRWLAYASERSGQFEVYVEALSGQAGRVQISTGGGMAPRWSPDGRRLYYSPGAGGGNGHVNLADLDVGDRVRVLSRGVAARGSIDFNFGNANYDVDPVSGKLLLIVFDDAEETSRINWILDWPAILEQMATAR